MANDQNTGFAIDIQAEIKAIGTMLDEAYKLIGSPSSQKVEKAPVITPTQIESPKPQSTAKIVEPAILNDTKSINQSVQALPNAEVKTTYVPKSESSDLDKKVKNLEKSLNNVSTDLMDAYKKINDAFAKPAPQDNFEERVTTLPTNLIFDDRVGKAMEAPKWR